MNVQKIPTSVNMSVSTPWAHTGALVGPATPSPRMDSAALVIAALCSTCSLFHLCTTVVNVHILYSEFC